jgi:hypothetical protein
VRRRTIARAGALRRRSDRTAPCCRQTARDLRARARAQAQHHVGERRPDWRLQVQSSRQRAAGAAGDEERHPIVIVKARVAHRRAIDEQRTVEQRAVDIRRVFQLLEEIRESSDVIRVDRREVENARLAAETPASTSPPCVCFGCAWVRKTALDRK